MPGFTHVSPVLRQYSAFIVGFHPFQTLGIQTRLRLHMCTVPVVNVKRTGKKTKTLSRTRYNCSWKFQKPYSDLVLWMMTSHPCCQGPKKHRGQKHYVPANATARELVNARENVTRKFYFITTGQSYRIHACKKNTTYSTTQRAVPRSVNQGTSPYFDLDKGRRYVTVPQWQRFCQR